MATKSASMLVRPSQLRPIPSFLLPFTQKPIQTRYLHHRVPIPPIPEPTPFVPDPETFLTLIGRDLKKHASKFPSWESLFSMTSPQLKELGVEPPRSRKYLLRWREKFRNKEFGIGGDLKYVQDGQAEVRVIEVPSHRNVATATSSPGMKKIIVNTPPGLPEEEISSIQPLKPVKGLTLKGARTITGPYVLPAKGPMTAKIVIQEGMWEDRRGHKIDGGERRQAEVRAKRRAEERRAAR